MSKLKPFEKKSTSWQGLWWHPEYAGFSSTVISLADLRQFKGNVRLYVRKNKLYEKGSNRPNYCFCLKDADAKIFHLLDVQDSEEEYDGRLYTEEEVRKIINGVVADVKYGIGDPCDLLPSDYV